MELIKKDRGEPAPVLNGIRKFCVSRTFMAFTVFAAALFIVLQQEVAGALFFVFAISALLVLCDDLSALLSPMTSMSIMLLQCYDSFNTFIVFLPLASVPAAALIFHLIAYRVGTKPRIGISLTGLIAVSFAVTFGGIGVIDPGEYFRPIALYYVGMLGFGMVLVYLLICSGRERERGYDTREVLVDSMYFAAVLAIFQMIEIYVELTAFGAVDVYKYPELILDGKLFENGMTVKDILSNFIKRPQDYYYVMRTQPGNNISTFIMITLPFVFYRMIKDGKTHLITVAFCALTLLLSNSRGGLLCGGIELVACFIWAAVAEKKRGWKIAFFAIPATAVTVVLCGAAVYGFDKIMARLISPQETRVMLAGRAIEAFAENPLFGHGIGNLRNSDLYDGKAGTLPWYHMMIPQVVGSMGLVGILAYLYQIGLRAWLTVRKYSLFVMTAGMSYFGLLLMSQVNPGEFCPIPYALIATILFVFVEREPDRKRE